MRRWPVFPSGCGNSWPNRDTGKTQYVNFFVLRVMTSRNKTAATQAAWAVLWCGRSEEQRSVVVLNSLRGLFVLRSDIADWRFS